MYHYQHGGNVEFETDQPVLDVSANINPLGLPPGVREAIAQAINDCVRYPDSQSRDLVQAIANYESVPTDWLLASNGASEIIFRLPQALKAKKTFLLAPSFSDYDRAARAAGSQVFYYPLTEDKQFRVADDILDALRVIGPDLIYLCNPNNPTGVLIKRELIRAILDWATANQAIVLVDECFLDFSELADDYTVKPFLERYPNLIILKAFTKLFALPGLRLGYAMTANQALLNQLRFHGPDWSVSRLAQAAGMAALDQASKYLDQTKDLIKQENHFLKQSLIELGFIVYDSAVNFVFLKNPYPIDLVAALDERGIRLRACSNFPGLDDRFYRIAVTTREQNQQVITAVADVIHNLSLKGLIHEHKKFNLNQTTGPDGLVCRPVICRSQSKSHGHNCL